ncbi:MAG: hypothetical protein ACTSWP_09710 [Candidatus Freyarchaeota archaeon]|nr:hypothetical protein [Candidatus Freyrarchaeum guaymaensis]
MDDEEVIHVFQDNVIPPQACFMLNQSVTNCEKKEVIEHEGRA